jgi:hypothetical protein
MGYYFDDLVFPMQHAGLDCTDAVDDVYGVSGFTETFDANRTARFVRAYPSGDGIYGDSLHFEVSRSANGPTEGRVVFVNANGDSSSLGSFPITESPVLQRFDLPSIELPEDPSIPPWAVVYFQARFADAGSVDSDGAMRLDNVTIPNGVVFIPVELTHFTATSTEERAAALRWQTASETGNDGFRVEHRAPGTAKDMWQRVGFVESKASDNGGTSQQALRYRFRVEDLAPGTHAFRLRQRDIDGDTELHGPVRVEVGMETRFLLKAPYPNPARAGEAATVRFASRQGKRVRIALYDARGRRVQALYRGAPAARQVQAVRIGGSGELASGTYFVRLRAENGSVTKTQALTLVR